MSALVLGNVVPSDLGWVDLALDHWDCTVRWSLRSRVVPIPVIHRLLWEEVPLQQAVHISDGTPVALVQLVQLDLHNGVAELSLLANPEYATLLGPVLRGFAERAFQTYPLRVLSLVVAQGDMTVADYFGPRARMVARLPGRVREGLDRYGDIEVFELHTGELGFDCTSANESAVVEGSLG